MLATSSPSPSPSPPPSFSSPSLSTPIDPSIRADFDRVHSHDDDFYLNHYDQANQADVLYRHIKRHDSTNQDKLANNQVIRLLLQQDQYNTNAVINQGTRHKNQNRATKDQDQDAADSFSLPLAPMIHPRLHSNPWFIDLVNKINADDFSKPDPHFQLNSSTLFSSWSSYMKVFDNVDPVPMCTSISPKWTLSLFTFAHFIQRMYSEADCTDYSHCQHPLVTDADANASPQFHSRFLYFYLITDDPGANGGLADRFKGMWMVLLMAFMSQRAFGIDHRFPVDIADFLKPTPWFRWSSKYPAYSTSPFHDDKDTSLGGGRVETFNWMMQEGPIYIQNGEWNQILQPHSANVYRVRANMNMLSNIQTNGDFSPVLRAMGLPADADMETMFPCFMQFAFRPTPRFLHALNPLYAFLHRPLLPLSIKSPQQAWTNEQASVITDDNAAASDGEEDENEEEASVKVQPYLICAQVRSGSVGGSSITWSDSQAFVPPSAVGAIINHIQEFLDKYQAVDDDVIQQQQGQNNTSFPLHRYRFVVYVTADNAPTMHVFQRKFGYRMLWGAGPIAHVDRSRLAQDVALSAFTKTLVDHWIMGECQRAIVSQSGFGTLGVWRRRLPFQHIKQILNDGRLVDYSREKWSQKR